MNVASLNNLWSYLQGLTLTPSNKRWLADHLYEAAKSDTAVAEDPALLQASDRVYIENGEVKIDLVTETMGLEEARDLLHKVIDLEYSLL
ncbi:MAG: hypothetical protein IJ700_08825 [Bacteroidaceae bacterium]|nr:hypothetical protein [Bacteroidaceae bacterium]MBR1683434.1 hypothetical protein [Bacteroidaceae bacterium]